MDPTTLATSLASKMSGKITSQSRSTWPEIRSALVEIGQEAGLEAHATERSTGRKEFLWDVVWIDKTTRRLEMAAESEMANNREVIKDFRRLLYAKTRLKLLICDRGAVRIYGLEQGPALLKELEGVLAEFQDHVEGEEYCVLDCYGNTQLREARQLHCYSWRANRNGGVRSDAEFHEFCRPIQYSVQP